MVRLLSGLALIAIVVGATWFLSPLFLLGLAGLVLILAFAEYAALAARLGIQIPRTAAGAAALAACASVAAPGAPTAAVLMAATIALASVVLASGRSGGEALGVMAASSFAPLYLGLPLGSLVAVRASFGREAALLLMVTVMISDTAQYYVGRLLGRILLAPSISPKKTVEGALGGFVAGTIGMIAIGAWWLPAVPAWLRGALGLAVVGLGIAGDLFESQLKRSAGVKDASALIPGHGGMLDRIDALLFAAPVYYLFLSYGDWGSGIGDR